MNFWTGHARPGAAPVLVREGFARGALAFGPLWLAAHRAWIPAALVLAADLSIFTLTTGVAQAALLLALAVWLGVSGHDLCRWSMRLRGFALIQVIAARDETEALARWLDYQPELADALLPPGLRR